MVTNLPGRPVAGSSTDISLPQFAFSSKPLAPARHLPMTRREMDERGWTEVDVVIVTGDAYIDHPSFAMAILGRVLEAFGYRVAILSQPDWRSCEPWKTFGRPRLFFAISAGNMDSMINHYTANRKVRNDDAYSPGGKIGLRPDRATMPYCQRAREAFRGVPIIAGGVEASLRRLAHYDYWSDQVKRSILMDAKADLVVYGMGESAIVEIAQRLDKGETVRDLRNMRGVAFTLGAKEPVPTGPDILALPSYEEVREDKIAFAKATRAIHLETNPYNARTLTQRHDTQTIVCTPPRLPESQQAMDFYYDLPYTRRPHPVYKESIPAFQVVKDSVTIMRGCFGGCTFCSITTHQGRIIQSRSKTSIMRELNRMSDDQQFRGVVSDLGGPTANMYEMRCAEPDIESICRRLSCVHPKICPLLETNHAPLISVMREAREQPGIRKVLVASGVRMDLAQLSPEYMEELTAHHVGGHLKVAPEHADNHTLHLMKKPTIENFQGFAESFVESSKKAGKKQYLVPYFISSHPGSTVESMIELAIFLKRNGYRPDQVQDFIPAPFDIAACMYHTGLDPMTMKPVHTAINVKDRRYQRALMQFFKPENYFLVRRALLDANRPDLIGEGCDALIPAYPPQEAIEARRQRAQTEARQGEWVHARSRMPGNDEADQASSDLPAGTNAKKPGASSGYRPKRSGHSRRERRR